MEEKLSELKELYESGENISSYLRGELNLNMNTSETIQAAYDLQAGSYRKRYYDNPEPKNQYCKHLAGEIDKLGKIDSLLLVGCGEAITLSLLLKYLKHVPKNVFGIDISFSRLLYAQVFSNEQSVDHIQFAVADLFHLPFMDNSIDLVLTNHSLEPNGGREKEALKELYRVSKKYVWMNEPSYEFGSIKVKKRIEEYGYVKFLAMHASALNFRIIRNELFKYSLNVANPTATTIIKKEIDINNETEEQFFACPVSKKSIRYTNNSYYCQLSYLIFPIVHRIPIFTKESGIVSFHFQKTDNN